MLRKYVVKEKLSLMAPATSNRSSTAPMSFHLRSGVIAEELTELVATVDRGARSRRRLAPASPHVSQMAPTTAVIPATSALKTCIQSHRASMTSFRLPSRADIRSTAKGCLNGGKGRGLL